MTKPDRLFVAQLLQSFLPVALLTCLVAYYFYTSNQAQIATRHRAEEINGVELARNILNNILQDMHRDISLVANHHALKKFLDQSAPEALHYFEQDMLNLAATSRIYNQIRWLDENGLERLRINHNDGQPTLSAPQDLQDKSARYYFTTASQLPSGAVYISPIDLNIEKGQIEFPPRPMLRIASPVFNSTGKPHGVAVLNYLGIELLARFEQSMPSIASHTLFLNRQGFWLNNSLPDIHAFNFSAVTPTFATVHPGIWQRITAADNGQFEDADGLWTFRTVYPNRNSEVPVTPDSDHDPIWRIVSHLPARTLYGNRPQLGLILMVVSALLACQLLACWKLTKARHAKRAANALVRQTNQNLQALVEQRTAQLQADITRRKQTEIDLRNQTRLYTMLSSINQAIVYIRDEVSLLQEACRIVHENGDSTLAWIGLAGPDGALQPVACAGIDKSLLESWQTQFARDICPAHAAFAKGVNVGSDDIARETLTSSWRRTMLAKGYRSTLSLPLKSNGLVCGVFSLYAAQPNAFSEQEIRLLDEIAGDIGFGMEVIKAEARLRLTATVFENSSEGVMVTDTDLCIKMINQAFTEITGYSEAEILNQTPSLLSSGRHYEHFYAGMWNQILSSGHWQGEVWNRRKNGEIYPELLSISTVQDSQGNTSGYVGVFTDLSAIKASEAKLAFLAHHDPLTRLPNRLMLFSRLEHGIEVAKREQRLLALLMLDLDRFKDVNDSFGHPTGDELLQQAAQRLSLHLRRVDTVSRFGGDEFTVLLEDITSPEDAAGVADNLIAVLREPWYLANGLEVHLSVSIGISLYPQHGDSAADLLQQADAAMYQAKASGGGGYQYFSDQLTIAARERLTLEANMRRALEQNEFRLYFQPQVDFTSGHIIGAEALLRWLDPQEGLIPPGRFIPVAETTGLICAIGEWVLRECCAQGKRWINAGLPELTLAVNVSPHQFLHVDLVETVSRILSESDFPANRLELELTESALMERESEAVETLRRLRELGVRLAIDDFGTGYSSLAYLKHFPLHVLKIDKSFVDDIPDNEDDKEIAATIIAMAHTLRFKVLAEGLETQAQLDFLQAQGCDVYQGYWKSPPLPAADFAELLLSDK